MRREANAYESSIIATSEQQTTWEDTCRYGLASAVDKARVVYYVDGQGYLAARGYDGRILWQRGGHYEWCRGIKEVRAGGNVALVEYDSGPNWGVGMCQPEVWPDIISMYHVQALDNQGKMLWEAGEDAVGRPVWTNGDVFVDVRLDVSKQAISRILYHKAKMPVWIELRRVDTHRCLWKRQLAGCPQELNSIGISHKDSLELVFKGDKDDRTWVDFIPTATPIRLTIPIGIANIDAGGLTPAMLKASH